MTSRFRPSLDLFPDMAKSRNTVVAHITNVAMVGTKREKAHMKYYMNGLFLG